jgi:hypothetical protein
MVMPRFCSSLSRSVLVPVTGLDQAGLAVVNVSGGAENNLFHDRCAPVDGQILLVDSEFSNAVLPGNNEFVRDQGL